MSMELNYENVVLLRGPAVLGVIVLSVLVPFIQGLSTWVLVRLLLVVVALFFAVYDGTRWAARQSQRAIQKAAHQIVLDDVLTAIFHPETGIIAVTVGMFLGNAAIYSLLPTTAQQRVHLVQHALVETGIIAESSQRDSQEAHKVLREPGGFLWLFPDSVREWLQADDDIAEPHVQQRIERGVDISEALTPPLTDTQVSKQQKPLTGELRCEEERAEENHSTASDFSSDSRRAEEDPSVRLFGNSALQSSKERSQTDSYPATPDRNQTSTVGATWCPPSPPRAPAVAEQPATIYTETLLHPNDIVGSILMDLTKSHLQRLFQSVPDKSFQIVGVAAATILGLQFRYSRRARALLSTFVQAATTVGASTTVLACILALVTRHHVMDEEGNTTTSTSTSASHTSSAGAATMIRRKATRVSQTILSALETLVKQCRSIDPKKWQGVLAAMVLLYVGRMRQGRSLKGRVSRR